MNIETAQPRPGLDLGIAGRRALVCGSTRGLGLACAQALAAAGVEVVVNGRDARRVADAAATISRDCGHPAAGIPADISTAEGRETLAQQCGEIDILVTNSQGPPTGSIDDWDEQAWLAALGQNMIGPILLIRALLPGMSERRWGRILNITSGAVKSPMPLLGLSNGARAGLTGFIAGLARDVAGHGVTINNLLPGHFATDRLRAYVTNLAEARQRRFEDLWEEMQQQNPTGRFGHPAEFGSICAFLASEQAAYITGQNLLLDGGAYRGLL